MSAASQQLLRESEAGRAATEGPKTRSNRFRRMVVGSAATLMVAIAFVTWVSSNRKAHA